VKSSLLTIAYQFHFKLFSGLNRKHRY